MKPGPLPGIAIAIAILLVLAALPARAEPDAAAYDRLLRRHVSAAGGRVDYAGLAGERAALDGYLRAVAAAPEPAGKAGLAFCLNAYNATVLAAVLDRGRPARVLDANGFFDGDRHRIAGRALTLNELETHIRTTYQDPRVHFALNCAARSCPPLPGRAFAAADLDRTLDELTARFLNGPGVQPDRQRRELRVTRLLDWYRQDFVADAGSVEGFLRRYLTDPARRAALLGGWKIVFLDYDWGLNRK